MEDVHRFHRSQQGLPEGRIPTTQHRSAGGWSLRAQLIEFLGCILRVQPNPYVWPRQIQNGVHYRSSKLLLRGHAVQSEERGGNLSEADGPALQGVDRSVHGGVRRRHGREVANYRRPHAQPQGGLSPSAQIQYCRDDKPQESEGGPAVDRAVDLSGTFLTQAHGEGQTDSEDHEEADCRKVGRSMRGGVSTDKRDDQQPPNNEPIDRRIAPAVIPVGVRRDDQRDLNTRNSRATACLFYQSGVAEHRNEVSVDRKDSLGAIDSRTPIVPVLPESPGDRPHRSPHSQNTPEARPGR